MAAVIAAFGYGGRDVPSPAGRLALSHDGLHPPHPWQEAVSALCDDGAISAVIGARRAAGKVRSSCGLLRCVVELHGQSEFRLDRGLFGSAEG